MFQLYMPDYTKWLLSVSHSGSC